MYRCNKSVFFFFQTSTVSIIESQSVAILESHCITKRCFHYWSVSYLGGFHFRVRTVIYFNRYRIIFICKAVECDKTTNFWEYTNSLSLVLRMYKPSKSSSEIYFILSLQKSKKILTLFLISAIEMSVWKHCLCVRVICFSRWLIALVQRQWFKMTLLSVT